MAYVDKSALRQASFITYKEMLAKGKMPSVDVSHLFDFADKVVERYEDWKFEGKQP